MRELGPAEAFEWRSEILTHPEGLNKCGKEKQTRARDEAIDGENT